MADTSTLIAPQIQSGTAQRDLLRIVIVGHVDHGKSTLVGRLIYDTDSLPDGKKETLALSAERRGMGFEWAFLMDAAQTERDQGVTIDTAQIWLKTPQRDIVIIDAPGHEAFLKNMVTGAAQADAAVLVVDAGEGVADQTRRHAHLLSLLGLKRVVVAVNKMDRIDYDAARFAVVVDEVKALLTELKVEAAQIIPISARFGTNVAGAEDAPKIDWWQGDSLLEALQQFSPAAPLIHQPLRFLVQDVYKFDDRRLIAGRVEQGTLGVGDEIVFVPSGERAKVASLENWPNGWETGVRALPGQSVALTLDKPLFVTRGDTGAHPESAPQAVDHIKASVFWLGAAPLQRGDALSLKLGGGEARAVVESLDKIIDAASLDHSQKTRVQRGQAVELTLSLSKQLAAESFDQGARLGRFVLSRDGVIVGGGLIRAAEVSTHKLTASKDPVTPEERAVRRRHTGGVLWLTGLSGSGKSTLAQGLERHLFDQGWSVVRLDGDDLRLGLNKDLGFSDADRSENIRRAAEVAALLARSGQVVIAAFVSPLQAQRDLAKSIVGESFREIYISTPVEVCEARDVKGLYKRARSGEVPNVPGISAPFEAPAHPSLDLPTHTLGEDEALRQLIGFTRHSFAVQDETVWP